MVTSEYVKQKLTDLKQGNSTLLVGDINTLQELIETHKN